MNYFRCGGSEKVTIDGVKVRDKLELKSLVSKSVYVSDLPHEFSLGSCCAVVLNGEIHVLFSTDRSHYKWNGSTWTQVSTLPCTLAGCPAVVLNDEIHLLCGNRASGTNYGDEHYKWDGTTWTKLPYIPRDYSSGVRAVVLNDKIHLFGGCSATDIFNLTHYEWNGTTWTQVSTLPYGFTNGAAVVLNGEIHLLGGTNRSSYSLSGGYVSYDRHYKWDGSTWTSVDTLPNNCGCCSAIVLDDEIHVIGGGYFSPYNQLYRWVGQKTHYILKNHVWDTTNVLTRRAYQCGVVVLDGRIYLLGGYAVRCYNDSDIESKDFVNAHECINAKIYHT